MNSAATLAASSGFGTTTFIEKSNSEVYSRKLKDERMNEEVNQLEDVGLRF